MSTKSTKPNKGIVKVGGDNKAKREGIKLNKSEIGDGKLDRGKVGDNEVRNKSQKTFKSKNLSKSKKIVELDFFILGAGLDFIKLR